MDWQRTLPPLPDHIRKAPSRGEGFDLDAFARGAFAPVAEHLRTRRAWRVARAALRHEVAVGSLTDAVLLQEWAEQSRRARKGAADRGRRMALLREVVRRQKGLLAHPVQLVAASALSERTCIEMATGEGKTLVTMMAAALQAAEGWPVHVITANDYLALRDLEEGAGLFATLGLSAGGIDPDATPPDRRAIYGRQIVYASSKEIAFDHLRDRIALGDASLLALKVDLALGRAEPPIMRGLWSAIVDEADSVMIDEARTPLIISAPAPADSFGPLAEQAMRLVARLQDGTDFELDPKGARPVRLTDAGLARVDQLSQRLGGVWSGQRRARELAERALYASHILQRDVHYILRDGKAEIVDENTGRIMADRTWSDGLHQMVEVKENLAPSAERMTLGRMTFQRFFRRYLRLSGLSGTLSEVRRELSEIYSVALMAVPTHRPSQRRQGRVEVLESLSAKWARVADLAAQHAGAGRPVLIGTRTVEAAEQAACALGDLGIPYQLLTARQDATEAEVIAQAGQGGRVTVATNMAGRGADIRLSADARAAGGLVVILTERHDSGRVDRQLIGRCGRQGDPGLVETILSAQDPILGTPPPPTPGLRDFDRAQARIEALHARQRAQLNQMEEGLNEMIAFAGGVE
jgi:preprotein translocase subunit SecA